MTAYTVTMQYREGKTLVTRHFEENASSEHEALSKALDDHIGQNCIAIVSSLAWDQHCSCHYVRENIYHHVSDTVAGLPYHSSWNLCYRDGESFDDLYPVNILGTCE